MSFAGLIYMNKTGRIWVKEDVYVQNVMNLFCLNITVVL